MSEPHMNHLSKHGALLSFKECDRHIPHTDTFKENQ